MLVKGEGVGLSGRVAPQFILAPGRCGAWRLEATTTNSIARGGNNCVVVVVLGILN